MKTRPTKHRHRQRRLSVGPAWLRRLTVTVAVIVLLMSVASGDRAKPVSSASLSGSLERLAVKNGVITIAPGGSADSVLEIGNEGRDLASTGVLYFRPNNTTAGSYFSKSADNTQNLLLTGNLHVNDGITLGGVRRTTWPAGDGWAVTADDNLTPQDPASPVAPGGLNVYQNTSLASGYDGLRVSNLQAGAPAGDFGTGWFETKDSLDVTGGAYVCMTAGAGQCEANPQFRGQVWTSANDGQQPDDSGPDADAIDGLDAYFLDDCGGGGGGVHCLCSMNEYGSPNCMLLRPDGGPWPPGG
jgi:hypothetical protein